MTPEEIIALAKRVGFPIRHPDWQKAVEEFAALVEEKVTAIERKELLDIVYSYAANLSWNEDFQNAIEARGQA